MRKLVVFLGMIVFSSIYAQEAPKGIDKESFKEIEKTAKYWKKNEKKFHEDMKKLKEDFSKFSPVERKEFFQQIQIKNILKELELPKEKQEETKKMLQEYFKSKDEIFKQFKPEYIKENISDEEARKALKQSSDIAQKLLDNRKEYINKFLQILTPQQVLKIQKIEKETFSHFKRKHKEQKEK